MTGSAAGHGELWSEGFKKLHTSAEDTVFGSLYSALAFAGKQEGSFGIFERCFVAFHIVNNAPAVRYCEGASHIVGCF